MLFVKAQMETEHRLFLRDAHPTWWALILSCQKCCWYQSIFPIYFHIKTLGHDNISDRCYAKAWAINAKYGKIFRGGESVKSFKY